MTRIARILLLLYVCAIVYLSLYPGDFVGTPRLLALPRVPYYSRRMVLDSVANVLFYMPLGAIAFLSWRRRFVSWCLAAGFGALLGYVVETAQLYTRNRVAVLNDVFANALGAIIGATAAYLLTAPRFAPVFQGLLRHERWRLTATGAMFLALWMLWHTFPFVPNLSLHLLQFRSTYWPDQPFAWPVAWEAFVGFLLLARILRRSWWLWLAFAALPAYLELADHSFSPALVLGAAAGWFVARCVPMGPRVFGVLLLAWLVFEEFRPFQWATRPQAFAWSPAQSWFATGTAAYYATIFRKLMLYTAVVWGVRQTGGRMRAVLAPMFILAAGEWTQKYLEGRTPEITDLLILGGGGLLLASLDCVGRPSRPAASLQAGLSSTRRQAGVDVGRRPGGPPHN